MVVRRAAAWFSFMLKSLCLQVRHYLGFLQARQSAASLIVQTIRSGWEIPSEDASVQGCSDRYNIPTKSCFKVTNNQQQIFALWRVSLSGGLIAHALNECSFSVEPDSLRLHYRATLSHGYILTGNRHEK